MLKFDLNTEEKITKTHKYKKVAITFEKNSSRLLKCILKIIKSFL